MRHTAAVSWWKKLFGGGREDSSSGSGNDATQGESEQPKPEWLSADDPGNPYPVPILNLMSNLQLTSWTKDEEVAARAISWGPGQHDRLNYELNGPSVDCNLQYRVAPELPNGMLFIPEAMEDKWVIGWKDGRISATRSWLGDTDVVAEGSIDGDTLTISRIICREDGPLLEALGDLVPTFDWLIKTHALETKLPLPVSDEGAADLELNPIASVGPFGHRAFCAAKNYQPPNVDKPLRSTGLLALAIQEQKLEDVEQLLSDGESPNAPTSLDGFRPLHLAVIKKDRAIIATLLKRGADIHLTSDGERGVLPLAVVQGCENEILDQLLVAAASVGSSDKNGFGPLHAAAEVDAGEAAQFLIERSADLEAKTNRGFTPLHIACALGSLQVVKALVKAGADRSAESNSGVPLDVARAEGKTEVVEWLENH